jgi:quercetin dioxygenase-like cupin family protein
MPKAAKKVSTAVRDKFSAGVKDSFGPTLKKARRIRHLTLDELADLVGCSASALSKIENQKATPSFNMVFQICQALRMDVTTLLQSRKASQALVTKAGRHPVYHTTGMEWTPLLPARPEHRMEASIVAMAPGARSEPMAHGPGELLGYVLEGKFTLTVDGKPYIVAAGDSFAFTYDRPHSFANAGARKARVMFILAPPIDFASRSRTDDGG